MEELPLNLENICFIINKAKAFHAQEEVVIPNESINSSEDWALQTLASHSDDMTLQEFKNVIKDLDQDQQAALVALMWIGRGDFTVDEWQDAYASSSQEWTDYTADYLLAHPNVADYLEESISQLGFACEA